MTDFGSVALANTDIVYDTGKWTMTDILVQADGTHDLGSDAARWKTTYTDELRLSERYFVFEGDSWSNDATDWPGLAPNYSNYIRQSRQFNYAVSGNFITTHMEGQYASEAGAIAPSDGQTAYFVLSGGINDLNNAKTASQIYTSLKNIWAAARADGYIVVASTVAGAGVLDATEEAERVTLNGSITGDATLYDYLLRPDILMPDPTDTNLWNVDQIHPNATGYTRLAKAFAALFPDYFEPVKAVPGGAGDGPNYSDVWINPNGLDTILGKRGLVGIGTINPAHKLDVWNGFIRNGDADGRFIAGTNCQFGAGANGWPYWTFACYYNEDHWVSEHATEPGQGWIMADGVVQYVTTAAATDPVTPAVQAVWDFDNARFGIGTETPDTAIHVVDDTFTCESGATTTKVISVQNAAGSERYYLEYDNTTATLVWKDSAGNTLWGTNGLTGNVGINDATPSYQLDVNGTMRVVGAVIYNAVIDHSWVMGSGSQDPRNDVQADWIEVKVGGATKYIPVYN